MELPKFPDRTAKPCAEEIAEIPGIRKDRGESEICWSRRENLPGPGYPRPKHFDEESRRLERDSPRREHLRRLRLARERAANRREIPRQREKKPGDARNCGT